MAWGLMDRELLLATLTNHDTAGLAAGYEILTGSVPDLRQRASVVGSVESTTP
jgi:hypothetical protein